ncbi:MAG: hypothetical protein IMX06_10320 [Kyrpidia tusciae]|nr:hypothetical protein [Kyrpidia tusciae]MBE3553240.1 hypothetical protein [Kyrpidia tusciae]
MDGLLYCRCEGLPMYRGRDRQEYVCPHCRASVPLWRVEEAILHALDAVLKQEVDYGRLIASALDLAARSGVEVGNLFSEVEGALSLYPDDPVKRHRLMRLMVSRVEYVPYHGTLEVAFEFGSRTEA